jgi:energy-converting hydrogenase Eha subunit H
MTKRFIGFCLFSAVVTAVALPVLFAAEKEEQDTVNVPRLQIQCKVSMTDEAGKLSVVAMPCVVTTAGQAATISFADVSGQTIEVELIGNLIPDAPAEAKN